MGKTRTQHHAEKLSIALALARGGQQQSLTFPVWARHYAIPSHCALLLRGFILCEFGVDWLFQYWICKLISRFQFPLKLVRDSSWRVIHRALILIVFLLTNFLRYGILIHSPSCVQATLCFFRLVLLSSYFCHRTTFR